MEAEPAIDELVALLERVGYTRGNNPDKVGVSAREVFQRAAPTVKQVEALRGMVNRIQWALDHPESDWSRRRH